jgi:hypothetical protein
MRREKKYNNRNQTQFAGPYIKLHDVDRKQAFLRDFSKLFIFVKLFLSTAKQFYSLVVVVVVIVVVVVVVVVIFVVVLAVVVKFILQTFI